MYINQRIRNTTHILKVFLFENIKFGNTKHTSFKVTSLGSLDGILGICGQMSILGLVFLAIRA